MIGTYSLPRCTPEEAGIPSSAVAAFLQSVEKAKLELHSFMLVRHGRVAAEGWWSPYSADRPHMLFSLSKSFASTAVGMAVDEGLLTVDDTVVSFFTNDVPAELDDNLASMKVRHLLSMSTGHAKDTTGSMQDRPDGDWVKGFIQLPVEHEPGTHFVYNSGASYMLSAIVQQVTGRTVFDYLTPRLFEPLGIVVASWDTCPQGRSVGGWGLNIKTEDIAKFGQLYLQKGMWDGRRLISEEWVNEATAFQVRNGDGGESDWAQGYGYQFWRCRHGAYRGDGAFGQYCIVMPKQEAVIAITSGLGNMQSVLDLIWEHLLPAMQDEAIANDPNGQASLAETLNGLSLLPPVRLSSTATAVSASGARYEVTSESGLTHTVSFDFADKWCLYTWRDDNGEHRIKCGSDEWIEADFDMSSPFKRMAAVGRWNGEREYVITMRFVGGPFSTTITCLFEEDAIRLEAVENVSFRGNNREVFEGRKIR